MTKYLGWIFFTFGGLAAGIMFFFFMQNKTDLMAAWDHKDGLLYNGLRENCKNVEKDYYYPCFKTNYINYLPNVGLTGTSLGLKLAFNMMDNDKEHTSYFSSENSKIFNYSLNYLEINIYAIANSTKNFTGFESLYSGYIGSLRDFVLEGGEFHNNIVKGLKGDKGIKLLEEPAERESLLASLNEVDETFRIAHRKADDFVNSETKRLKEKYKEE